MNSVVIVAAGSGRRMNLDINKQYIKLDEKEMIAHTIDVFYSNENIDEIIVCIREEEAYFFEHEILDKYDFRNIKIAYGGKERQDSIYNGLKQLDSNSNIVLIHDGVRPIIDSDLIVKNIENVKKNGSAISSDPQKETTIMLDEQKQYITEVTNREFTYIARAPQSFFLKELLECHNKALKEGKNNFIDSASLMMNYGKKLSIVECNTDNLKITTPDDFYIVRAILEARENMQIFGG